LNPETEKRPQAEGRQKLPDNVAHYRLLMLNLHEIISGGLKLERIFRDLQRKYGGDYIYGKSFVTETALEITDTLDRVIFHLNALTAGNDIALFYILDSFKRQINECFDEESPERAPAPGGRKTGESQDPVSVLLRRVMELTIGKDLPDETIWSGNAEDATTVRDLLIHCYDRAFAIIDSWFRAVAGDDKDVPAGPLVGIPTSYMLEDNQPILENLYASDESHESVHSNPGITRFLEGVNEVPDSSLYTRSVEGAADGNNVHGMMIYSNETMALYHCPGKPAAIVAANICDAVGSNYIYVLMGQAGSSELLAASAQFYRKLLDRLDFRTSAGYGFITAFARNMTRGDTESHLNMLGKLLSFAFSTEIPLSDDESVQRNIDVFLEYII
jgi:hypothetical protein